MFVSLKFNNLLFVVLILSMLLEQPRGIVLDDSNFRNVAEDWCTDSTLTEEKYGPISTWNVSQVTYFTNVFRDCRYDLTDDVDLNEWDVSNATTMSGTFSNVKFNPIVSNWDVSRVMSMSSMFSHTKKFSQDLSAWNVSSVTDMGYMFHAAELFNSDLSKWDVSQVIFFDFMFGYASKFDSDISKWNVSNGNHFYGMFYGALSFGQSLCWDNERTATAIDMFTCSNCANNNCGNLSCTSCQMYSKSSDASHPIHFLKHGAAILAVFWYIAMK